MRFLIALIFGLLTAPAMAADEPPHRVIERDGDFAIRAYSAQIIAEVEVVGSMSRAGNRGFQPLANYIFGSNQAPDGGASEIAMTTPVTTTRSREIAMTTPVTQTASGEGVWRVAFIMPPEWTMETLPRPDDQRVDIREVPARTMAIIRFSGGPNDQRFMAQEARLRDWIAARGLSIAGEAVYARYDPPWVPTFLRRNEVMIPISA